MFSRDLIAIVLLPLMAATAHAQKLIPASSEIAFVSNQMGVPVEGHFRKFDANLNFDPKDPGVGKVTFSIDTGSASMGAPEVDGELLKAHWFSVSRFPKATFESSAIKATGQGKFDVTGTLRIKGNEQTVVVPVQLVQAGTTTTTATGSFFIKRLAFKVGENEWMDTSVVANDVQVKFRLALAGMAPV